MPDSELDYDEELTYRWRGELFSGVGLTIRRLACPRLHTAPASRRARPVTGIRQGCLRANRGSGRAFSMERHGKLADQDGHVSSEAVYEYGKLAQ